MKDIISLVYNNWDTILIAITSIVTAASVLVKITPSETDDKYVLKALKFLELIALNNKPAEIKKAE
jgi:hypothetical protein